MYSGFPVRKIVAGVIGFVLLLFVLTLGGQVVQNVDSHEVVVIQSPVSGQLHWYWTAGLKPQWFGKVTTYKKRDSYDFEAPVTFNDAGGGTVHGSIQYELPLNEKALTNLHNNYGSQEAIKDQVIKRTVDKVIYMTGPLMSSRESYAEKRTDLINLIQDQVDHGIYRVRQRAVKTTDDISGQEKTVVVAEIVPTASGLPARQEPSIVGEFGLRAFNFAIQKIDYNPTVQKQIDQQQQIAMDVQTAIANARKAEQQKITVEQQGAAEAAKAKWEQEVVKAQQVTLAQQKLEVQKLAAQEAQAYKEAQILRAEGDAEYKRRVMSADGALTQKLDALVKIAKINAEAVSGYRGSWVPNVQMGSGDNRPAGGAFDLMNLLTAKTARDLSLDMSLPKGNN